MLFNYLQEIIYNVIRWHRTIYEKQVVVRDVITEKIVLVVLAFIQPNDLVHSDILENTNVLGRVVAIPVPLVSLFHWSHKCHKLAWYNPV